MNNNKIKHLFFLLFVVILSSCGPSMNAVWQKEGYTAKPFKTIAVIAISKNLEARKSIENQIVKEINKTHPNVKFVTGLKLVPPNASVKDVTEEKIKNYLETNQVDLVITTSLVHSYSTEERVSGNPVYYPNYYRVGRYIYSTYDMIYSPDYYEQVQKYVLESNLFDLREGFDEKESLIWVGQSEISNPSSISSGAESYAKNLIKFMEKEQVFL